MFAEESGIWVTCTNADLLARFTWDGDLAETWSWRDDGRLVRELGLASLPATDLSLDYRDPRVLQGGVTNVVHLNAVTRGADGLLLGFGRVLYPDEVARRQKMARLGRAAARLGVVRRRKPDPGPTPAGVVPGSRAAIVELRADGSACLRASQTEVAVPNHNVLECDGTLLYNDTNGGRLFADARSTSVPGEPSFARGLAHWRDDVYLVGSQRPFAVHAIDVAARRGRRDLRARRRGERVRLRGRRPAPRLRDAQAWRIRVRPDRGRRRGHVKLGFAGLGWAARAFHVPAAKRTPGAELVGGYDSSADQRASWTSSTGLAAYESFEELSRGASRTSSSSRRRRTRTPRSPSRALAAGLHVLCEKPFVATVAEADTVLAAAERAGRQVAVNHEFREKPIFKAVKDRIGSEDAAGSCSPRSGS